MRFVQRTAENRPVLISGDFNAEPIEPVYSTVINYTPLGLSSAYADLLASISSNQNGDECDTGNGANNKNGSGKNAADGDGNSANDAHIPSDSENVDGNGDVIENDGKNPVDHLISHEPPYTTWKIREDGEVCHTIDYVFYSRDKFKVKYRRMIDCVFRFLTAFRLLFHRLTIAYDSHWAMKLAKIVHPAIAIHRIISHCCAILKFSVKTARTTTMIATVIAVMAVN